MLAAGSACLIVSGRLQGKREAGLQIRGCGYGTHRHLVLDVEWLILPTPGFFLFVCFKSVASGSFMPESLDLASHPGGTENFLTHLRSFL